MSEAPLLVECQVEGRGRGLFAARDIPAGEMVLAEQPAMLFVQPEFAGSVCACCLRTMAGACGALSALASDAHVPPS